MERIEDKGTKLPKEWAVISDQIDLAKSIYEKLELNKIIFNGVGPAEAYIEFSDVNNKTQSVKDVDVANFLQNLTNNGADLKDVFFNLYYKQLTHTEEEGSNEDRYTTTVIDQRVEISNENIKITNYEALEQPSNTFTTKTIYRKSLIVPIAEISDSQPLKDRLDQFVADEDEREKSKAQSSEAKRKTREILEETAKSLLIPQFITSEHDGTTINKSANLDNYDDLTESHITGTSVMILSVPEDYQKAFFLPNDVTNELSNLTSLVYYLKRNGNPKNESFCVIAVSLDGRVFVFMKDGVFKESANKLEPIIVGRGFEAKKQINPILRNKIAEIVKNPPIVLPTKKPYIYGVDR